LVSSQTCFGSSQVVLLLAKQVSNSMAYDYGGSLMKKLKLYLVGGGEAKSILQMYQVY
jgi:hypothetical protein